MLVEECTNANDFDKGCVGMNLSADILVSKSCHSKVMKMMKMFTLAIVA